MREIEALYHLYKQDIYNYLLSISHDPILSEDLLSETFIKAIYSLSGFRGEASIKTWFFSIARHLWLQHLRRERKSIAYNDMLDIYVADSIIDQCITKEISNRIKTLLGTKDFRTQAIVDMRINGISYHEISERLGITENSARVIDFRAKKWLKTILKKEGLI